MPRSIFVIALLFLYACTNHAAQTARLQPDSTSKNADSVSAASADKSFSFDSSYYTRHTRTKTGHYKITFWKNKREDESPVMILQDESRQSADTLELKAISTLGDKTIEIKDITKVIGFSEPVFSITWRGESDNFYSEIVGFRKGHPAELFELPGMGLSDIHRLDEKTLTGLINDKDRLIYNTHANFIVRISLEDSTVKEFAPDTLVLDADTRATEAIHAFRLTATGRRVDFTLQEGTSFHLDTLFGNSNLVHFHLPDSTRLVAVPDSLESKVVGNTAG